MAKIITVAHQKGGVGKSTMALNLALCFQDQLRVALVDSDLQGSIYHVKDDFPGLAILTSERISDISSLDYDLVIVDTPPYLSNKLNDLFDLSDFVLVPTKAGFFDVMAVRSTLALIKFSQAKNTHLKAGIVLNMIKPRSGITKDISQLLQSFGTPLLKTMVHDRVSITRSSMTSGILKSTDVKAIEEITSLAEEIVNQISA
ncbi:ParA family protein [Mucilaginibacter sp. BJC16-A38]|uniref:ParA family protein n=1 Tax=Mucilaginibacter phenanthrenivorans TaxID=1234842 RepID=UPI00215772D3|nr:ParA family protein [Mucilaginibacter phenanthrenivorans]MCR8559045.1 ParA family protein [Mucilaginibacter phenanthrenivorans]